MHGFELTRQPRYDALRGCIEEYLQQRGLPLRKPFRCLSPAHEDNHPSMHFNRQGNQVHCFSCGVSYDLFDLVGLDYGLERFPDKFRKACEIFRFPQPDAPPRTPARNEHPQPPAREEAIAARHRDGELAALRAGDTGDTAYFHSRGITPESCEKYGLFQAGGRAYFPVWDEDGRCVGWAARAVDDTVKPRYKNATGAMGLWVGGHTPGGETTPMCGDVFVTEGVIDAICLEQLGCRAVALCGSQNTAKLIDWLGQQTHSGNPPARLVLCGDPDRAGKKMNADLEKGLQALGLPSARLELQPGDGDIAGLYAADLPRLEGLIQALGQPPPPQADADPLDDFFAYTRARREKTVPATGIAQLDCVLDGGLHPGLYVIGAISSVGKTSFALQVADHIAAGGGRVLFVSLEQSRHELIAKSLCRISARIAGKGRALTVRQLLSGKAPDGTVLEQAAGAYRKLSGSLRIVEGIGDIGAAQIREMIERYPKDAAPQALVIDYLQILRPADPRATDKQNTDHSVVELKRLSRDFDLPVIAISSFNRENYRAPVSMESFKESGAVEYSSDVLLGLQLAGVGTQGFDVNRAKSQNPRKLELVMLKNRTGVPWVSIPLEYNAKVGSFTG